MKIDNIDATLEEIQDLGDQMRQINEAVAQVGALEWGGEWGGQWPCDGMTGLGLAWRRFAVLRPRAALGAAVLAP
jgi:hypothetical protein